MKKISKFLLSIIFILSFNYSYAATVDHFDVKLSSEETTINKAVDMTIEAKDSNGNTIKDYRGTILILSETDPKAEFPKEVTDNSYTFKETDQGKVKFENALIFKNMGKQQVNVFDFNNEEVVGQAEINIIDEGSEDQIQISIISPTEGIILTNNYLELSGKTKKNHQVVIKLTGEKTDRTIKVNSDDEGMFTKKLENLEDGNYTVKASVLNTDNKEAGVTNEIKITLKTKKPEYNSLKITPIEIYTGSKMNIELKASKGLKEVKATIDDNAIVLKEIKDGVYTGSTTAPAKVGEYDVDIKLVDEIGNELIKKLPKELEVLPNLNVNCDPEIDETCKVACDPEVDLNCDPNTKTVITKKKIYKINNLHLTRLKTKSVLTWEPINEAISYNIYKQLEGNRLVLVDNVRIPTYEVPITGKKMTYDYYVVEPVINNGNGQTIKGQLSEVTEIQTGPKELLIIVFLSFLIGLLILVFRNKLLKL